jgi:hypothetical protein
MEHARTVARGKQADKCSWQRHASGPNIADPQPDERARIGPQSKPNCFIDFLQNKWCLCRQVRHQQKRVPGEVQGNQQLRRVPVRGRYERLAFFSRHNYALAVSSIASIKIAVS